MPERILAKSVAARALSRLPEGERAQIHLSHSGQGENTKMVLNFPEALKESVAQAVQGAYGDMKAARDFGGVTT